METRKISVNAEDLKPSQNDLYLGHIFSRFIVRDDERKSVLNSSLKDLDMIISQDDYIIDGHHRWALVMILDPTCEIICTQIKKKFDDIIDDLDDISDKEPHKKSGEFKLEDWIDKKDDVVKNKIIDIMKNAIKNGVSVGENHYQSDKDWKLKKYLKKIGKKLDIEEEDVIDYLYDNLKKIPRTNKKIERKHMPQVKKEDVE